MKQFALVALSAFALAVTLTGCSSEGTPVPGAEGLSKEEFSITTDDGRVLDCMFTTKKLSGAETIGGPVCWSAVSDSGSK